MGRNPKRDPQLSGRPRRRVLDEVRRTQPDCWLCGYWINQDLERQKHPLGSTVDEHVPRSQGGSALDASNVKHAHRFCNSWRGTRRPTPALRHALRVELWKRGWFPKPNDQEPRPQTRKW